MFCTQCGAQNPDDARFCYQCGAALPSAEDIPPPPVVTPAPPVAPAAPPPPPAIEYAGFWRRFLAMIIDGLILGIPTGLIAFFSIIPSVVALTKVEDEEMIAQAVITSIMGWIWIAMLILLMRLMYWTLFECSKYQATPGKMVLGIIVTDYNGQPLTLPRSLGRNLGKVLSHLIFHIGFIMAGLTQKKQALHDMLADCLVVMR
jgi:uncharacterized RDD family membrane protein YckC